MSRPRYRRRKAARPREITEAAFATFAEKGYAAARVDDVARRAGVSKGLTYLYFKTKADLFRAVVKSVVVPRLDRLAARGLSDSESVEAFMRGPLADFMKQLPGSRVAIVIRLMIGEGSRHPELVDFYRANVVERGLGFVRELLQRGFDTGEFRNRAVLDLPQLVIAPALVGVIWRLLFGGRSLDTDRLIDTHLDALIHYLKYETQTS